ncbi:gamma-aminobutyric acid receptor subunit gamma-2 isoform X2 [Festucalex cinctus]
MADGYVDKSEIRAHDSNVSRSSSACLSLAVGSLLTVASSSDGQEDNERMLARLLRDRQVENGGRIHSQATSLRLTHSEQDCDFVLHRSASYRLLPDGRRRRGVQQDVGADPKGVRERRHAHPQRPPRRIRQQTEARHRSEAHGDPHRHVCQQHRPSQRHQHGIHHRHLFCSDLVRPKAEIQQHDEGSASQQQHGGEDLDSRHLFPQLQEGRRPLDHNTQSHASDLERRADPLHAPVDHRCGMPAEAEQLPDGRALVSTGVFKLWLPQGGDCVQVEEKLSGGGRHPLLEALPVLLCGPAEHLRDRQDRLR